MTEESRGKKENGLSNVSKTVEEEEISRHARLAALSNRMRKEFGPKTDAAIEDQDEWLKNLHPWHKRILAKPGKQHDGLSPKIPENIDGVDSPILQSEKNLQSFYYDANSATPTTSKAIPPQQTESTTRRARLAALTNRMRREFDKDGEGSVDDSDSIASRSNNSWNKREILIQDTLSDCRSLEDIVSSPPSEPPPPLPTKDLRSPPPLPPRNPLIQLPVPVTSSQEKMVELTPTTNSSRPTANSTESITSSKNDPNSHRKRGHMKTLSLDRDFTLSKSLRNTPFPTPSSKSNSLTRQTPETHEEELRRAIEAEGVINEITSDLQISGKELDSIPSCSSSISSPINEAQAEQSRQCFNKLVDHKSSFSDDTPPLKTISESECSPAFHTADHRYNLSDSSSTNAALDPITRDVERRLSMKVDRSATKEFLDDSLSGHSSLKSSSIDQAKFFAKSASSYASSIFRGAISKVKQVTHTGSQSSKENDEETTDSDGEQSETGSTSHITSAVVRPRKAKKGPFDFQHLRIVQEMNHEHSGAVWCIRFSACGRLLATAGADCILRVWCLNTHIQHFQAMRERYQQKMDPYDVDLQKNPSWDNFEQQPGICTSSMTPQDNPSFAPKPFAYYKGHNADILDLSWSKNYFILSSGMDRTAKLWHISRNECLCCFQHQDFVTSVSFLPKDDRYFVSGSLDGRIRIWNIPEKKVVYWNEVEEKLITALTFVKNGKFIVVGTYYGKCYFYTSELKYHTVISTRIKNAMGNKVTGLSVHCDKLLVTFNDSRVHMYDIRDKVLICKFRGAQHERSQIRASFSPDGRHVVCGSEDKFIYLWRTCDAQAARRDRNSMWERVRAHKTTVTVALFAPDPQLFLSKAEKRSGPQPNTNVIASADLDGSIKIMLNREIPKEIPLETIPEKDVVHENLYRENSAPKVNF